MRFQRQVFLVLLLLPALALLSCNKTDTVEPSPDITSAPVFTGIYITTNSPDILGIWRPSEWDTFIPMAPPHDTSAFSGIQMLYPVGILERAAGSGNPIPSQTQMFAPYPNPAQGLIRFVLTLPDTATVTAWIVRAQSGQDDNPQPAWPGQPFISLLPAKLLPAGYQYFEWAGRDDSGADVASGYFRFYLKGRNFEFWSNFVFYRNPAELPATLRTMLQSLAMSR